MLAFSLVGIGAVPAAADPADDTQAAVDAAQATLDEAESRMAQINSEYEQLTAEVAELQTKIDETAAAAMEAQQAMLEGRAALGQVAVGEYRDGSSMGLLGLILDSKNFDELLRNMEYVTQIMSYQADEVAEQKERKRAFDDVSDELNAQKNEQEEALAAQEAKRAEAQSVVEDATGRLEGAQEEHAARLAELAAQAEALRKQKRRPPQRRPRPCRRAPTPIRAIASRWSPTTRAPPITAARRVALAIPAAQDHRGIPAAPAAPATGADPAARRRKGGFQAWPRPTAAAPIRTRRTPAPRPPAPSATTTPWAWRCPNRCRTTAVISDVRWKSSTAVRPCMPR
ncbi:MAG: coiled-coil domain-containing protein [Adlercreutzia equolifaciens]